MNALAIVADLQPENWQFELGEMVTHKDQPMPSLVMVRQKAGRLGEVYGVRSFATVDPIRDRTMLGASLVSMGGDHPDWLGRSRASAVATAIFDGSINRSNCGRSSVTSLSTKCGQRSVVKSAAGKNP